MTFRAQLARARHTHEQKAAQHSHPDITNYHQGYADGIGLAQYLYEKETSKKGSNQK